MRHRAAYNPARASGGDTAWAERTSEQKLGALFNTSEEIEIAVSLDQEIRADKKTCLECASYLILANHDGKKMDVLRDLHRKGQVYGLSEAQHKYAADIMLANMPRLLEVIAAAAEGENTIAQPMVDDEGEKRQLRQAEKQEQRIALIAEHQRLAAAIADCDTETNPLFGAF